MSLLETPVVNSLAKALDLTSARQRVVSQNIANIDTPGYRTRDIDFRAELQRAMSADENVGSVPHEREVTNLIERPDGNNVSIDRESLLMAQNQLQFQVEVQLLRSEFGRLQLAINGGNSQ